MRTTITRAVDYSGSAEEVIDRLLAPIMYRVIFLPWTLTDDYGQSLTKKLFDDAR